MTPLPACWLKPAAAPGRRAVCALVWTLAGAAPGLLGGDAPVAPSPGEDVAVIYNLNFEPESREVAEHYARRRGVPERHLIGLSLPRTEALSRAEFRDRLQEPLVTALRERGLAGFPETSAPPTNGSPGLPWSKVRYLVLAYGVPVSIQPDPQLTETLPDNLPPALRRNEAAVDSELAALPQLLRGGHITGALVNPGFATPDAARLHPTNGLFLVARLDGPSADLARALVDRALAAETNGLWGRAYFDLRSLPTNSSYFPGDLWIRRAADTARRAGFETVLDEAPETFPAWTPLPQIALYAGWYDSAVSGPFAREAVEFMPGAVAYHIHSFSARTVRHPRAHWVGPLLARGAAATLGCVAEPYLDLTPHVDVLFHVLLSQRRTLGEAAYAAQPVLSWQTTVLGDPLYRPMAWEPRALHAELERTRSPWLAWSVLRVVNLTLAAGESRALLIEYLREHPLAPLSAVLAEKLGDLYHQENLPHAALARYRLALAADPSPLQRVQLTFKRIALLETLGRPAEALEELSRFLEEQPAYPNRLHFVEQALRLARQAGNAPAAARFEQEAARLRPAPTDTSLTPPEPVLPAEPDADALPRHRP